MNAFAEIQAKIGQVVGKPSPIYDMYKINLKDNVKANYIDPDYVVYIMHKVYNIKHVFDFDGNLDTYFELKPEFPDVISATGKTSVNLESFTSGKDIFLKLTDVERREVMQYKSIIGFVETTAVLDFYKMYLSNTESDFNNDDEE